MLNGLFLAQTILTLHFSLTGAVPLSEGRATLNQAAMICNVHLVIYLFQFVTEAAGEAERPTYSQPDKVHQLPCLSTSRRGWER